MPDGYQDWKDSLRVLAQRQGYLFDERDSIHFVFAMPKSWSQKRKAIQLGTFHRSKPDLDNLLKSYYDALCEDDASVAQTSASKSWGERSCIIVVRHG
jgi:Holliday junction resolvase RusA-like endonuclease